LYADNAGEFRTENLVRATSNHTINLQWRPVARPAYGAHIERLVGTLGSKLKHLPGTTFSSIAERGPEYKSEEHAALTFAALERILVREIIKYHHEPHSELKTTPMRRWEDGIYGNESGTIPTVGLPDRIVGARAEELRIDFMPSKSRPVRTTGVTMLGEEYYDASILGRWVGSRDEINPRKRRNFLFKYNPNDITVVHFFDPDLNTYQAVGYRDPTKTPGRTLDEAKAQRKIEKQQAKEARNNNIIYDAGEQNEAEVKREVTATQEKKRDRRARQHKRNIAKAERPLSEARTLTQSVPTNPERISNPFFGIDVQDVVVPNVVIHKDSK
jgi:putative transposase